ncbi:MAG: MFS transporter [Candidatus Gracilibacteria bacterium]|nr:MFS transporter [Candidatus Gracilibacteria bacterium]
MTPIKNKLFFHLLGNTILCSVANNFIWFALVFWVYLETKSIMVTSFIGGLYLFAVLISGIFFGAVVDHNKKKNVMIGSTGVSLLFFIISAIIFFSFPLEIFTKSNSILLWLLIIAIMFGVIIGNIRMITMSTMMTLLFDDNNRDKANGVLGIANGLAFGIVSVFSGLTIGFLGMGWAIIITIIASLLGIFHLLFLNFPKEDFSHQKEEGGKKIDLIGTIKVISGISGLFGLIFFSMFNNFLGGVFMSLMDPYGLSLVSVEIWGFIWGFLSFGFIVGGLLISKWGVGKNPVKTLLLINVIMWIVCIFFTSISSIVLTTIGLFIFMILHPYIEATEQTILQKVVPYNRQGRVFGFSQSVEQIASPLTAFFIGPITELIVVPFMNSQTGMNIFLNWFGTTQDRAIAIVFSVAGLIGLIITLLAFLSKSYKNLSKEYKIETKKN